MSAVMQMHRGGADIDGLRATIAQLDLELIDLVARRCGLARRVGEAKRRQSLPILDPAHEASVVRRAAAAGRAAGLEEEALRRLMWTLVALCREAQAGAAQ